MHPSPVVLFDGVCNLCNSSVDLILRLDRLGILKFSSLQSTFGQSALKKHALDTTHYDSILLVESDKIYTQSTAVLRITKYLGGAWPAAQILLLIPTFIRNAVYQFVARNRYRWFGKSETCRLPTPELKARFLE